MIGVQTGISLCLHFSWFVQGLLRKKRHLVYSLQKNGSFAAFVVTAFDCTFLLLIEENTLIGVAILKRHINCKQLFEWHSTLSPSR